MRVSIVIPSYNTAGFLAGTLTSVLTQSCRAHEIVVVDDGSTDNTRAVVQPFGPAVKYMRQENQGVSAARNAGLGVITGDAVLFLDADDQLAPRAIEIMSAAATRAARQAVIFGDVISVDVLTGTEQPLARPPLAGDPPRAAKFFFQGGGLPPGSFLIPVSIAHEVQGFDRQLSYAADMNFFLKCGSLIPFVHVGEVVLRYLTHEGAMSRNRIKAVADIVLAKLAFLAWCREHGLSSPVGHPDLEEIFVSVVSSFFYSRQWDWVDAALATNHGHVMADRDEIHRLWRLRQIPSWVFRLKDSWDAFRGR
jgi:glycosyltransferase involved in cell wall biosynthesis